MTSTCASNGRTTPETRRRWLPTPEDHQLLRQETAARLLTEWELATQQQMRDALREVHAGGSTRINIPHPRHGQGRLARLTLVVTPVREPDYEADEIELDVAPISTYAGTGETSRTTDQPGRAKAMVTSTRPPRLLHRQVSR